MFATAQKTDRMFSLGIVATLVFAVACFTPFLSGLAYVAHMDWVMDYADYVLFPALAVSVMTMIVGYLEWSENKRMATA